MGRVVVVGAGVVGLSVSRAALLSGHEVTLLEQGSIANSNAASYDQHRMIRYQYGDAEGYTRMVGDAFDAWDRLWDDLGVRHFSNTGTMGISLAAEDYTARSLSTFRKLGIPHEVLDRDAVERTCPQLSLPVASWGLLSSPFLRQGDRYKPVRMQVGYYVMDASGRFRVEAQGRAVVITNCDGQMFKFGPLIGARVIESFDGKQSAADLNRWAAGY